MTAEDKKDCLISIVMQLMKEAYDWIMLNNPKSAEEALELLKEKYTNRREIATIFDDIKKIST